MMSESAQETEFFEQLLQRFQEATAQSILNKRTPIAKNDPKEELYELHLEIQEQERQFRECVDISVLILKRNRELSDLVHNN